MNMYATGLSTQYSAPSTQHSALSTPLTPVNQPRPVQVQAAPDGTPRAVLAAGQSLPVAAVVDRWRIDDEWWREEISRFYYRLALADGRLLTVFQDLIGGGWYAQRYGP